MDVSEVVRVVAEELVLLDVLIRVMVAASGLVKAVVAGVVLIHALGHVVLCLIDICFDFCQKIVSI